MKYSSEQPLLNMYLCVYNFLRQLNLIILSY